MNDGPIVAGKQTVLSATFRGGDAEERANPTIDQKDRRPRELGPNPSKVSVSMGLTRSLGEMEFARFEVRLEDYCEPTRELRRQRYDELQAEARAMVGELSRGVDRAIAGRTQP